VILLFAALAMVAFVLPSAYAGGTPPEKPMAAPSAGTVAFLLPENVTPRWEGSDAPIFKQALQKLVPGVQIDVLNALNDPNKQQSQAEAELTKGAKVLVIAAVDQKAAAVIGGTSLFGGRGSAWSALLGALVIGSVSNGLDLMAQPPEIKYMVEGAILLIAVSVDAVARRSRVAAGR